MYIVGIDIAKRFHKAAIIASAEFGMEATGHYWLPLYAHLRQAGQSVYVINPLQSDALRNIFVRQTKNDTKDALIVAEVISVVILKLKLRPKTSLLCANFAAKDFSSLIWLQTSSAKLSP